MSLKKEKISLSLIHNVASLSKMTGKTESFLGKNKLKIETCSQTSEKLSY